MKKILTREITICDFEHEDDVDATGVVKGSGKDACPRHMNAFKTELRFPEEFNSKMSGYKESIDPEYTVKMIIKYTKVK